MSDEELIKKYVAKDEQKEALAKLQEGYPVQYLIGNVEFYHNIIMVNENVLIPRFETEYLVEKTINFIKKLFPNHINILEVGTGSGCISISLKKNLNCDIDAFDNNEKALEVAKKNALNNNVTINFFQKDIYKFTSNKKYDVLISNPPYVAIDSEIDEKIKYEPQNAIYAKDNGLEFYQIIMQKCCHNLAEDYLIAFEIGDKEGKYIRKIIEDVLPKAYIHLEKDYNNYERYLFISNKNIF